MRWKRPLAWIAGAAVAAGIGGFVFAAAGFAPIAASSGHWAVTDWALHFAMRRAVKTQSLDVAIPPDVSLDDRALILRGAGHYESGCAPCHGTPATQPSVVVRQMTPKPPHLPPHIPSWEPEHLFWIVKHGVKFTAMPAWPALHREDEVWAMVAFLRRLPDLSEAEYRDLAAGDTGSGNRLRSLDDPIGAVVAESCARCHGAEGLGRGAGAFPKLAGQTEPYLLASLRAYAAGERHSGFMEPVAAMLDDAALQRLAAYYAAMPAGPAEAAADGDRALGARIAARGIPKRGVPACVQCHGPKDAPRAAIYPQLAGQYADYITLQLEAFAAGTRGGTPFAHIMRSIAEHLEPAERKAVAAYYSALAP